MFKTVVRGEPKEMPEWAQMAGGRRNTWMTGGNITVSGGYIYACGLPCTRWKAAVKAASIAAPPPPCTKR